MAVGGTQPTLRKYLGALKDTTTVSLAKVNSDYKELDIAIVKATNHVERPSKEKYIREIFHSISAARPRADVAYCIHALARRLSKTRNWAVALKTLIVIHRALREVDPTFREELINYGRSRSHMLNMSYFKDVSSAEAWDYSAWVRIYALYLEERLECFRVLKYDVETDPPVALESVKLYTAISDGTINLVDKFFEMQRSDAVRALDVYKRATNQAVLAIEYKKETEGEEKPASPPPATEPEPEPAQEPEPEPEPVKEEPPKDEPTDLLGLNEPNPAVAEMDEKNALALAIVPIDDAPKAAPATFENGVTGWELALVTAPSSNETAVTSTKKLAGGLDLLTLDSLYDDANRRASQTASYNPWDAPAAAPMMMQTMAPAMHDPFYASGGFAAPHGVQMAAMAQQQQAFMLQQQMMTMAPAAPVVHHPMQQNPANPFGNPFAPAGAHPYGAAGMPLHAGPGNGYTGLI
ncbi:hypothetical protein PR202_ga17996 [Eleusine coracana subsp. coracana]|uniref:ENTH domain-containing protein n=1 Tax=Eleusine coracana subsp. coracana TaxID=191504 RepID=A0AAV5CQV3_ELECO|nr:hypothetical protein PR202_ga17996 [Eleusine coracana subsp. coracana]